MVKDPGSAAEGRENPFRLIALHSQGPALRHYFICSFVPSLTFHSSFFITIKFIGVKMVGVTFLFRYSCIHWFMQKLFMHSLAHPKIFMHSLVHSKKHSRIHALVCPKKIFM